MRSRSGGSGGPAREELSEERGAFARDPPGGLDVGLGARLAVELFEGDARLQEPLRVGQAPQRLVGGGDQRGRVVAPGLPLRVGSRLREQAGAVEVQEGGEDIAGELVDEPGAPGRDVFVAEVGADDVPVLALDESVVVAAPGPRLGEFGVQLLEHGRDPVVDELGAVVRVEALDDKGKKVDQALQHRDHVVLRDRRHRAHELELGDRVHDVDDVHALDPVQVPLVDRVHAQVPGLPHGIRRPALADLARDRAGVVERGVPRPVGPRAAQVVDVARGDRREALVLRHPELVVRPAEDVRHGLPRHPPEGDVRLDQQQDVRARVHPLERAAAVRRPQVAHTARLRVLPDAPSHLRRRQPRHESDEVAQHPLLGPAKAPVAEPVQRPLDELARRLPVRHPAFKNAAALHKATHLLYRLHPTQVDIHNHPPIIADSPPLHDHVALESHLLFTIM